MDFSAHRTYLVRPTVMAILMIATGILTIQFRYDVNTSSLGSTIRIFSGLALVVFGGLILLPRFNNVMSAVGMMCFGIGLSRFIIALSYMTRIESSIGFSGPLHNIMLIISYVTLIFSVYMMYIGFNFMRMDSLNAFIMRFTSMGVVLGYTVAIIYCHEFLGLSIEALWGHGRQFILSPVLYIMYFVLLCSREVYDRMSWETVRKNVLDVAGRMNPGVLTVTTEDLRRFRRHYSNEAYWVVPHDDSVVGRELRLNMKSENGDVQLLLEKWVSDGNVYYSIVPADGGGYVAVQRGKVRDIKIDAAGITVYNPEHIAMRVDRYDKPVERSTFLSFLHKYDDVPGEAEIDEGDEYESDQ